MEPVRIIFMGSHPIALHLLNFLFQDKRVSLAGIVSQPDRPSGRGHKCLPNPISQWALEKNVPLFRPEKPREETVAWMKDQGCALILVMAYGHILGKAVRETPHLGIYNLHASLLPRFRGAAPIEAAIASGVKETGISLMEVVKEMDAGDVFATEMVKIEERDSSESVTGKLSLAAKIIVEKNLEGLINHTLSRQAQDLEQVTFCRKIEKEDSYLNFEEPASVLVNRIRSLTPRPGCTMICSGQPYKIESYKWTEQNKYRPCGLFIAEDGALCVACGRNTALVIDQIQRPGGKKLPTAEFLRGDRTLINVGRVENFSDMRPFEAKVFPF